LKGVEASLSHFIVKKAENGIIGVAGMELYPPDGLLRSVAVEQSKRHSGIGADLCADLFEKAGLWGISNVYLLTTTALGFFHKLGFEKTDRDSTPKSIQLTEEFSNLCPSSATCMIKTV